MYTISWLLRPRIFYHWNNIAAMCIYPPLRSSDLIPSPTPHIISLYLIYQWLYLLSTHALFMNYPNHFTIVHIFIHVQHSLHLLLSSSLTSLLSHSYEPTLSVIFDSHYLIFLYPPLVPSEYAWYLISTIPSLFSARTDVFPLPQNTCSYLLYFNLSTADTKIPPLILHLNFIKQSSIASYLVTSLMLVQQKKYNYTM